MNRKDFHQLAARGPLLLDAVPTAGCGARECPEKWLLEHFEVAASALVSFRDAGCDIVRCPSAGANRLRLGAFGLASQTGEINRELMRRCRATLGSFPVFGTCSIIGRRIEPFGDLDFEEAVACYGEQAKALADGGAEGFIVAAMNDIQEARAALIALRELGDFPVIVEMSIGPQGRTQGGTDPVSALVTLQSLKADAVGFGAGDPGLAIASIIAAVKPFATVPLGAVPATRDSGPEAYAALGPALVRAGANLVAGDRHATAEHMAALGGRICGEAVRPALKKSLSALSSCRSTLFPGPEHPFAIVGERINPTGKKQLQASLREGSLDMVQQFAIEQEQRRAAVLDVNMGLSGIDEMAMMLRAVGLLSRLSPLPLCIDTTRPEVAEAALRRYPGRALVNSVSGERERIERTLPAAARYGAMFIVLPLTDAGIPATVRERIAVIDTILAAAASYGCTVDDIVVDGLVMTISSNPEAARDTLDLISWCSQTLQANTIVGLSNVSFGMPERQWINGAFLGMAMGRGLTMAIANPSSDSIMATVQACNALRGHDAGMLLRRGNFSGGPS
ncbi:MAG: dihydropteroate synthase [Deltaproteobacteria bacterium]|nr:dihydropteroate synthase [Deltaproteobacteria bacterium]